MRRLRLLFFIYLMSLTSLSYAMSDIQQSDEVSHRPDLHEQRRSIEESSEVIAQVKSAEPFVNIVEEKVWNFEDTTDESTEPAPDLLWLADLFSLLAVVIEAALWLLPLLVIFYLYKYREYWINLVQGNGFVSRSKDVPDTLFGLDISEQSLPDDVPGEAAKLWNSGEQRHAVSLLYRASLAAVFRKYTFELPPGATEQDCMRQVEQSSRLTPDESSGVSTHAESSAGLIDHFRLLTDLWIQLAYAHKLPADERFYLLCNKWNQLYNSEGVE